MEKFGNNTLKASNFDQLQILQLLLVILYSKNLLLLTILILLFCFQGEVKVNWGKCLKILLFIQYQINLFGSFPHKVSISISNHSLFSSYHGVEHHHSTVILLGPSYDIFNSYCRIIGCLFS